MRSLSNRSHQFASALLLTGISVAVFIACGSGNDSATFGNPNGEGTSSSGQSSGTPGSTPLFGDGDGGGSPGTDESMALSIDPPSANLEIASATAPATVAFRLLQGGKPVAAAWSLDRYEGADITAAGAFTSVGLVAGTYRVIAQYKGRTIDGTVNTTVRATGSLANAVTVSGPNTTALAGSPTADPGGSNATSILYPLDGTVFPRGVTAPKLQFSPGSLPPEGAKVTISCNGFSWSGIAGVSSTAPQVDIPDDLWSDALTSCGGQSVTLSVTKANGGTAYGPATIHFTAARGSLKGVVFYMSYSGNALGLWSTRPGVREPAKHLTTTCVVCHSVSANGATLVTGADAASELPKAGTYVTAPDGTIRQASKSPATLTGGDGRGFSWGFLTPDGKYALRAAADFWGGTNTLGFKVNPAGTSATNLAGITVNGLSTVSAFVPQFSPDGKKLVFINGAATSSPSYGAASKSLSVMDANIDAATDTITFSNRTAVYDSTAMRDDNGTMVPGSNKFLKLPVWLPDMSTIVYQEGDNFNAGVGYGGMLASYQGNTGRLFMVRGGKRVELSKLNTTLAAVELDKNYGPTALPVQSGGYYWVVFTSKRGYGNTLATNADVHSGQKRLWVAAIDPSSPTGVDASHPAFYLPNQSDSENERGFFALEPCKAEGGACAGADTCCGTTVCRPDRTAGGTGSTCQTPPTNSCRALDEVCSVDGDCCDRDARCLPDATTGGSYCRIPVTGPR